MKRVLIVLAIFVLIVGGYVVVVNGFSNSTLGLEISSYKHIQAESDDLTIALASYNDKNTKEYDSSKAEIANAIKKYNESKKAYEELIEEIGYIYEDENQEEQEEEKIVLTSSIKAYEIDYLLTRLGNYSSKEGLESLKFDVEISTTTDSNAESLGYILCNLKFSLKGEYMNIANFLYDIENDDELSFEIRDYAMEKQSAAFTVKDVPIRSATFIETVKQNEQGENQGNDNLQQGENQEGQLPTGDGTTNQATDVTQGGTTNQATDVTQGGTSNGVQETLPNNITNPTVDSTTNNLSADSNLGELQVPVPVTTP